MRFSRSAVAVMPSIKAETNEQLSERTALDCEIMYLLESNREITQRALAIRLGVSVGHANYCLRSLAERGWLQLEQQGQAQRKGRCVYVPTPKGIAERGELADRLLRRKRDQHDRLQVEIVQIERDIERARRSGISV